MKHALTSTHIELHVPDFEKVKEYYRKIGFKIVWERKPEEGKGYLVIQMGENILCFWPGNEYVYKQQYFQRFPKDIVRGYGVEIVIVVDDIETYYLRVKNFVNVVEELKTMPWGLKDFRAIDPFGYYLRFTEPDNILSEDNAID